MADPRFRDSIRPIQHYSLLSFMTPRQFYYPRVVLQFYHSMTSRGAPSPLELRFSINDRPGVLRAADISAALGLQTVQANAGGYRDWPQSTHREMVRILARDTTAEPVLFRRQLPPQMLLIYHLLRTSLFPLQNYVQRRGAILEALYRILEGFWFSPSELVMTALLPFEDKVHHKGLARAESIPLLMSRLLCQVLEHLGFPEEPRIERRFICPQVLSMDRAMVMPISFSSSSRTKKRYQIQRQRTLIGEIVMLLSPRWRGVQFQIYLLHLILHLLQPQPQLILPADHIQHSTRRSMFMLVPGSWQVLWMLSVH